MQRKILLLSPLPPPIGGIARLTETVLRHGLGRYTPILVDTSVKPSRGHFREKKRFSREAKRTFSIFIKIISSFHRNPEIQIMHVNANGAVCAGNFKDFITILIARLYGKRVVVQYHSNLEKLYVKKYSMARLIFERMNASASCIAVLNNNMYRMLGNKYPRLKPKLTLIPNFVGESWSLGRKNRDSIKTAPFRVGFVGDICPEKGCFELFQIAKRLPQVEIVMIGRFIEEDIQLFLKDLKIMNVKLQGVLEPENVKKELEECDIFIFPSHSEACSLAILEAMSVGLPVIATRVGAAIDVIDDGAGGFLYEVGNVDGMLEGVNHLMASPGLCQKMGAHNRDKVKQCYSIEIGVKRLTQLYDELLGGQNRRVVNRV